MTLKQFNFPGETRYLLHEEVVYKFKIQFHSSLKDLLVNSFQQSEIESVIADILNGSIDDNNFDGIATQHFLIQIIRREWNKEKVASNIIYLPFHSHSYTLILSPKKINCTYNQITENKEVSSISKDSGIFFSNDIIEKAKMDTKKVVAQEIGFKKLSRKRKISVDVSLLDQRENSKTNLLNSTTSAKTNSTDMILQENLNFDFCKNKIEIIDDCNLYNKLHAHKKVKLEKDNGVKVKKNSKKHKFCFVM